MANSSAVKIIKDTSGEEWAMIRVDKTLKETLEEKPSGRWDPEYWHSAFQTLMEQMGKNYEVQHLGDFIDFITYGQVGSRKYSESGTVRYIQTINLTPTGIDYFAKEAWIEEDSHNDPPRSRLQIDDVLLGNAGMGGLGKVTIFNEKNEKVNISQDIDILRFKGVSPHFVVIFLKTIFGNKQIWIRSRGVGAPKLPFDEIKAIKLPRIPENVQNSIASAYENLSSYHEKAMEEKKRKNDAGYKKNIVKAETMLRDLISHTEAVIRGERNDVL